MTWMITAMVLAGVFSLALSLQYKSTENKECEA